ETLAQALKQPRFVLYLGRKSCPPAAPLAPRVVDADSAHAAITGYLQSTGSPAALRRLAWGDGVAAGMPAHFSVPRKDRVIRRRGWLFGDRAEHVALFAEGG
ncbi:MAG: hypothetical protein MUF16_21925, partial [Burkholderiaceae bacterium]|nr:hypothetical protein [Burkholderiaceae bacterium]